MSRIALIRCSFAVVSGTMIGLAAARYFSDPRGEASPSASVVLFSEPEIWVRGHEGQASVESSFGLRNLSDKPVRVLDVGLGCTCLTIDNIRGEEIPAGGERRFAFGVSAPEEGFQTSEITVKHSAGGPLLRLKVHAAGAEPVPYFTRETRRVVAFLNIDSVPATRELSLVTVEDAGQPRWLGELLCSLPEAEVGHPRVTEERIGTLVKRTYAYPLTLTRLPPGEEFSGQISARKLGGQARSVGSVSGTFIRYPFTPRFPRASAENGFSEVVVVAPTQRTEGLQLAEGWTPPDWLSVKFDSSAGRQTLRLKVVTDMRPSRRNIEILLQSRSGDQFTLPVEIAD